MINVTEQIKDRIDIVEFIKQYIELKPAGGNYKALCPFHQEKTPSLMVSPAKQIFKCFGCGKGGDIFTFLTEYEGIEFKEALQILANKAGVTLPRFKAEATSKKSRLHDILKLAADFYHLTLLKSKSAQIARDYLKKRQIDDLTRDNFKLGYGPDEWRILFDFLRKKGLGEAEILRSGLVKRASTEEHRYYDIFRGRLLFPISDEYSRVVGFGGRILEGVTERKEIKDQPKYINTPQTEVYDKSRVLYGLDKAKESIRQQDLAVLVEGYMDVISSHQADVRNVVAASGTALTENQLKLLKRFTNNISLAFDMDEAGVAAALRSYQIAAALGINTKIIRLPQGKDPDELIKQDVGLWRAAIEKSQHIIDYYFAIVLEDLDTQKLEEKKKARQKLLPIILAIEDPLEKAHFLEKLAVLLKVRTDDLTTSAVGVASLLTKKVSEKELPLVLRSEVNLKGVVEYLLALILAYPQQVVSLLQRTEMNGQVLPPLPSLTFTDKDLHNLYKEVQEQYNRGNININLRDAWRSKYGRLADDLQLLAAKDYALLEDREIKSEFTRLLKFLAEQIFKLHREKLISEIKLAEEKGDEKLVLKLIKLLDKLLRDKL